MPEPAKLMATIRAADRSLKAFRERGEAVETAYEGGDRKQTKRRRRLNLFQSNIEILKSALYSRTPTPQIERRFAKADSLARLAAEILTRAVQFHLSEEEFDQAVKRARDDWKIPGLGQVWCRYEPLYGDPITDPETGKPQLDDEGQPLREVAYECVKIEHVRWKDFGFWPLRVWSEVQLVWRPVFLTAEEAAKRLGADAAKRITYDVDPTVEEDDRTNVSDDGVERQARLIECWDKQRRQLVWLDPKKSGAEAVLKQAPDPYGLQDFFPCPEPLFATLERGKLIPIADYDYHEDQYQQIDDATAKIAELTKAIKVRGAYNGAAKDLAKLFKDRSDRFEHMVEVENWAHFRNQQGGLEGNIDMLEIRQLLEALKATVELRKEVKQDLYEASGISDIVRGSTQASETLGAQELKSRYAGLRLQDDQGEIAFFARNVIRIMAELIAEHFSNETLAMLTGLAEPGELENILGPEALNPPQPQPGSSPVAVNGGAPGPASPTQPAPGALAAMAPPDPQRQAAETSMRARALFDQACDLLRQDVLRTFQIEIETDSTVSETILADQQAVEKLLLVLERILGRMAQLTGAPALLPMFKEILLLALRKYRVGRAIEGRVESAIDQAIAELEAAPKGPAADPDLIKKAADMLSSYKDKQLDKGMLDPDYEQGLEMLLKGMAGQAAQSQGAPSPSHNGAPVSPAPN